MSRLNNFSAACGCLALVAAANLAAQQIPSVYFTERDSYVTEQGEVGVDVLIAPQTLIDVVVPFRILLDSGDSTLATIQPTADADGDYFIDTDSTSVNTNVEFDPATGEGTITIPAGGRFRTLTIALNNDFVAEGTERIVIELLADQLTAAKITRPDRHTIYIQDNDGGGDTLFGPDIYFDRSLVRSFERNTAVVPVRLHGPPGETLILTWEYFFRFDNEPTGTIAGRADGNDIVVDESNPGGVRELTIPADSSSAFLNLNFVDDVLEEGDETLFVRLVSLTTNRTATDSTAQEVSLEVDDGFVTVEILDDDPTHAYINLPSNDESAWGGVTIREGIAANSTAYVTVSLTNPVSEAVYVPLTFGGTGVRVSDPDNLDGTDYFADYTARSDLSGEEDTEANQNTLVISAGNSSSTIRISTVNDMIEETDKTVTISLGTPTLADSGTTLALENVDNHLSSYTITITDDDPVSMGFALRVPDPDDEENFIFQDFSHLTVAESDQSVTIPIQLSGNPADNVKFKLEVVSSGTTAKMADLTKPLDGQEWDFYINPSQALALTKLDTPTNGIVSYTSEFFSTAVVLNNDIEPALPYSLLSTYLSGGTLPDEYAEIEGDETIQLRLVEISNTADSGVTLRSGATDFTLTIKEMPDIDVSAEFSGLDLDTSAPAKLNSVTNLHEIPYQLTPHPDFVAEIKELVDPDNDFAAATLRGYTAYKLAFQPAFYGTTADAGDDIIRPTVNRNGSPSNHIPDGVTPYYNLVDTPFSPRYVVRAENILVKEGEPQIRPNVFRDENASVYVTQYSVLQPLKFGSLDAQFADWQNRTDDALFSVDDAMDFVVEFFNRGRTTFDWQRLDRNLPGHEDAVRVLLSRTPGFGVSATTFNGSIERFEENDEDGTFTLGILNPSRSNLQIEYFVPGEGWKVAQPGTISGTSSYFLWVDSGPPKTYPHPRDVEFRLYRITNP